MVFLQNGLAYVNTLDRWQKQVQYLFVHEVLEKA